MTPLVILRDFFENHVQLPDEATTWLLDLWGAFQVFDDVADGDSVDRDILDRTILSTLVFMPMNPFYVKYCGYLSPIVENAILKWKASDDAERCGKADAKSFVWRAGYYDIVLAAVTLVHGSERAMKAAKYVMWLYGETLDDYRKEFDHA